MKKITNAEWLEAIDGCINERWEIYTAHYAASPVVGLSRSPNVSRCHLCMLRNDKEADCADCPLGKCGQTCSRKGSLYNIFEEAETNPEKHTASVNMTAKLRELRDEYAANVEAEKPVFKVGESVLTSGDVTEKYESPVRGIVSEGPSSAGNWRVQIMEGRWQGKRLWCSPMQLSPLPTPTIEVGDFYSLHEEAGSVTEIDGDIFKTTWASYDRNIDAAMDCIADGRVIHAKPAEVLESIKFLRWAADNHSQYLNEFRARK